MAGVLARGSERKPAAQRSARSRARSPPAGKVSSFPTRLAPELRLLIPARVWTRGLRSPAQRGLPSAPRLGTLRFGLRVRGGRGASREGDQTGKGRGGIPSSARSDQAAAVATAAAARAGRAAEGTAARGGQMQQMRGVQVAGPDPAALREGSAQRPARLRQLTFLAAGGLIGGGSRGAERGLGEGLLTNSSVKSFSP